MNNLSSLFSAPPCQSFFFGSNSMKARCIPEKCKDFSALICEPLSPFISDVNASIQKSLILRPGVSYKEKFWCGSSGRRARVGRFSRTGMDFRNGLFTKIGFFFDRRAQVSAGSGSDSASHSSRILLKRLPALLFHAIPPSTPKDIYIGLLLCKDTWAGIVKSCHMA